MFEIQTLNIHFVWERKTRYYTKNAVNIDMIPIAFLLNARLKS